MNIKNTGAIILSCVALLLSGCASMFGDNDRTIHVTSNPAGVRVFYKGDEVGETPVEIPVNSTFNPGAISVKKEGYNTRTRQVTTSFQGVGFLNVFFWPGFIVDAATGDMMRINSKNFHFALTKKESKTP